MASTGNQSEVANLLERIDQEYESAKCGLDGLAEMASHERITCAQMRIAVYHERLQALVGEDAMALIVAHLDAQQETAHP
jgi:hypothetical protein